MLAQAEGQALSLFPLANDRDCCGVLEIRTPAALTPEQTRLVSSILRVVPQLPGPAGLQRTRHAHGLAQPQDLRWLLPARGLRQPNGRS